MVGTPYQVAVRLYQVAATYWPLLDAHYYQIDLITFPPHRFLNLVYAWCTERIGDTEKIEEWEFQMAQPLPGQELSKVSPMQIEDEGAGFMAVMGMVT